jgi:hypothetical protein
MPQPVDERVVAYGVLGNAGRRPLPRRPGEPSPWSAILLLWAIAAVIWTTILLHL